MTSSHEFQIPARLNRKQQHTHGKVRAAGVAVTSSENSVVLKIALQALPPATALPLRSLRFLQNSASQAAGIAVTSSKNSVVPKIALHALQAYRLLLHYLPTLCVSYNTALPRKKEQVQALRTQLIT